MGDTTPDEPIEGCPDCGADTLVADPDTEVVCTSCGWRP